MHRENKGSGKAAPTLEKMGQEGEFVLADIKNILQNYNTSVFKNTVLL